MSAADHLMWIGDRYPELASTVVSVAIVDGAPNPIDLEAKYERMSHAVIRLRQRVRANPLSVAPPRWEIDPEFDIDNHVRWVSTSRTPRTMRTVLDIAAAKALEPFPSDRPLWEVTAVPDLPDNQFALIQKIHHAITDGINGVRMQLELFDFESDAELGDTPKLPDSNPLSQPARVSDAVRWDLNRRRKALERAIEGLDQVRKAPVASAVEAAAAATSLARVGKVVSDPLSALMTEREDQRRFDTLSVSLSQAKEAGRAAGTKLNAVFLGALSEGLARYHRHHGVAQAQIRLGMPISTRTDDSDNNAFVGTRFALPLVYDNLPAHLRTIERLVKTNSAEPGLGGLQALGAQLTRLPGPAAAKLFRRLMAGTDVQASNVPGSPLPTFLLGNPLVSQFPFGPTTTSSLNVTLLSYMDSLDIGVASNTGAIADPETFMQHLHDGFEAVLALAN